MLAKENASKSPESWRDLTQWTQTFGEFDNAQQVLAAQFLRSVRDGSMTTAAVPSANITLTGHSLGGGLASNDNAASRKVRAV
ncbi:MAG: hypothetical protein LCH61_03220 [Proteobacteria bacterium]|nr:hypothetical protein [Pseudomonadota bacterium]